MIAPKVKIRRSNTRNFKITVSLSFKKHLKTITMKIITTLFLAASLHTFSFAQLNAVAPPQRNENPNKVSFVISSGHSDFQRAKFTPSTECREIIITGIPVSINRLTSVIIDFDTMGSFAFKKDAGLTIPESREVFIEDKLTGKIFNLRRTGAYKFNVNEISQNRFVLHVLDKSIPEAVVSSK